MTVSAASDRPARDQDFGLAGALVASVLALAAYTRTLAPDILYSDSAEFQTLAYTLGTTHSTGYPIYLLLARLVGFLPISTAAWRINFVSALGAAAAVGATYLTVFRLTRSHLAGGIGAGALAVSYTVWTQAVIAEVYTPALALYTICLLRLWDWQRGDPRHWQPLFITSLLVGVGLGIHASVGLLVPVVALVVVIALIRRQMTPRERLQTFGGAAVGGLVGVALFVVAFILIDAHDHPSSFVNTTLLPSRSAWNLSAQELMRPLVRFWVTVSGLQWRDAMLSGSIEAAIESLRQYGARLIEIDFSALTLLLACIGLVIAIQQRHWLLPAALAFAILIVANYHPGDWYVFFLPTYPLIAAALGVAVGAISQWWRSAFSPRKPGLRTIAGLLLIVVVGVGTLGPVLPSRGVAVLQGSTFFSQESYVFPVDDPWEPRRVATAALEGVPDNAILVWDWRSLYSLAYVAYVEGLRPGIVLYEATPHGTDGRIAQSLLETIDEALTAGQRVFVDRVHDQYQGRYELRLKDGDSLYELAPRSGR